MLKSNLAIFTLLLFFLSGCSESIRELESRIKKQAEKNNFNYKKHNLEIFGLCENCKLKN